MKFKKSDFKIFLFQNWTPVPFSLFFRSFIKELSSVFFKIETFKNIYGQSN